MSVLVEGITVIFRNATADSLIAGGIDAVNRNSPNRTFRTDGLLSAIGFMTPEDTENFVDSLKAVGFNFIDEGHCVDIAVCDQNRGFTSTCEWLATETDEQGVRYCWLLGHDVGEMAVQEGWSIEKSLYNTGSFHADGEPKDHLEFLRTENGLNVYLDKNKGKEVYVGRPFEDVDDIKTKQLKELVFASAVKTANDMLTADGWMFINANTDRDASRHLILRYRNQIGVIFLDVNWNETPLTSFDGEAKKLFIEMAQSMKAIPILTSIDIQGDPDGSVSSVKDVENCRSIEFRLRSEHLAHDLAFEKEWSETDYDLNAEIELSDWEIHDFGIQVVRQTLEKEGHQIFGWNSDEGSLIQIFTSIDGKLTHIVVNTVRYPKKEAEFKPEIIRRAAEYAAREGAHLQMASVSLASADDPFDSDGKNIKPIYRGAGVFPRFTGLEDPVIFTDG